MRLFVAIAFLLVAVNSALLESASQIPLHGVDTTCRITGAANSEYVWNRRSVRKRIPDTMRWQDVTLPEGASGNVNDLTIATDSHLILLTSEHVFASADQGHSWRSLITMPKGYDPREAVKLGARIWIAGSRPGPTADLDKVPNAAIDDTGHEIVAFVKALEEGSPGWSAADLNHTLGAVLEIHVSASTLLVRTPYEAMISYDFGESWHSVLSLMHYSAKEPIYPRAISCGGSERCWVAFSDGSVVTGGAGKQWSVVTRGGAGHTEFTKLVFIDNNVGVGQRGTQLWLTKDSGASWNRIMTGLKILDFYIDLHRTVHALSTRSVLNLQL